MTTITVPTPTSNKAADSPITSTEPDSTNGARPPFDSGRDPHDLENPYQSNTSGLEVGIIVGVVVLVVITVIGLFVWRARRNRVAKKARDDSVNQDVQENGVEPTSTGQPVPPPKDERGASSSENDAASAAPKRPVRPERKDDPGVPTFWGAGSRSRYDGVEEHEIVNRV